MSAANKMARATAFSPADRIARIDWSAAENALDEQGFAIVERLINPRACREIAALYDEEARFRSHITMARHGFGQGEYKYFAYPLPDPIGPLRAAFYARLAPIANRWCERLGVDGRYPAAHAAFLKQCHAAGQVRPTPLVLRYGPGDYNCLHQDLYGDLAFPLQVAALLSAPDNDFSGGEFVLTEQRPRRQSRASVVPLGQGDAVVFAVNQRPVDSARGTYRVTMRHGVSSIRSGHRHTLGLIFHDAA